MEIFMEIHQGLPREAPGDDESTLRALKLMINLPASPSLLDIGCGPGAQTISLACHSHSQITAVDMHQPFLNELNQRAVLKGISSRINTVNASMFKLPFTQPFDAIWSEGAIYIIGFAEGLKSWRPLLKPGGYVAVTELSWIKPAPPKEIVNYWLPEYPGMATVEENLARIQSSGYHLLDHFILPESAWWQPYYHPMAARITHLREKYLSDPEAQHILDNAQLEIEMYHKYSAWYGYVFYVMQG